MRKKLTAPFSYFGGKSLIADTVWRYFGNIKRYMEPFFGSGAVLLARPDWAPRMDEIACDKDGHIANIWRSIKYAPAQVAKYCDNPNYHVDFVARKKILNKESDDLFNNLIQDEKFFSARLAGCWIWCANLGIARWDNNENSIPQLSSSCKLTYKKTREKLEQLSRRLKSVKVISGDWSRICGGNWQTNKGSCGIFFDPPYSTETRDQSVYRNDSLTVADDVEDWCVEHKDVHGLKIIVAGYAGEHDRLEQIGWKTFRWKASGGWGNQNKKKQNLNRFKETLWLSPNCDFEKTLFDF